MDRVYYSKLPDGTFSKTVFQPIVVNVKEEAAALAAQVADLKAGEPGTPADQVEIDAVVVNYEAALIVLKDGKNDPTEPTTPAVAEIG